MDREKIAAELVRLAKELVSKKGCYYEEDRNGLRIWCEDSKDINAVTDALEKVDTDLDPTESYKWIGKKKSDEYGTVPVWGWYGLFGMTKDVAKALEGAGFEQKRF